MTVLQACVTEGGGDKICNDVRQAKDFLNLKKKKTTEGTLFFFLHKIRYFFFLELPFQLSDSAVLIRLSKYQEKKNEVTV